MTPGFNASLDRNGCVKCFFSDDSFTSLLRSCVVIASNRTQINSTNGITYIDVFEFRREGKTASGCINMSTNDFDIFAFTFAEGMPSISGQGLTVTPIIEGQILNITVHSLYIRYNNDMHDMCYNIIIIDQPDEQNMIILFTVSATLVIILGVLGLL